MLIAREYVPFSTHEHEQESQVGSVLEVLGLEWLADRGPLQIVENLVLVNGELVATVFYGTSTLFDRIVEHVRRDLTRES